MPSRMKNLFRTGSEDHHHSLHIMSQGQLAGATSKTAVIWVKEFVNEPYEVDFAKLSPDFQFSNRSSFDLKAAAKKMRNYFYQVSLPHYQSGAFLDEAIERSVRDVLNRTLTTPTSIRWCE